LQRTDDGNERILVRRLEGIGSESLRDALLELSAMSAGARSRRGLYHANIDWRADEHLTDAQKIRAVERLAQELGFTGQPSAVVEHVKEGREHLHVVWLRIDTETGKAIPDSHNYRKHELVARELERAFGHERVQGAHIERDGVERPARTPEAWEYSQAGRSGVTPAEAKAELTAIWQRTDSGQAFEAALAESGWMLARGDKRDFVAIDGAGETHSLARRIEGAKAKDVRERLADIDPATLPGVEQARQAIRDRQRDAQPALGQNPASERPAPDPGQGQERAAAEARYWAEVAECQAETERRHQLMQETLARWEASQAAEAETPRRQELAYGQSAETEARTQQEADRLTRRLTGQHQARPVEAVRHLSHSGRETARALEALAVTDPLRYGAAAAAAREIQLQAPEPGWTGLPAHGGQSLYSVSVSFTVPGRSFAAPAPQRVPQAHEGTMGDTRVAAPSPEATQWPSCEAGQSADRARSAETARMAAIEADRARQAEASRLQRVIEAARQRLMELAARLDRAIERHRERVADHLADAVRVWQGAARPETRPAEREAEAAPQHEAAGFWQRQAAQLFGGPQTDEPEPPQRAEPGRRVEDFRIPRAGEGGRGNAPPPATGKGEALRQALGRFRIPGADHEHDFGIDL